VLTWTNNSKLSDGTEIERMISPDTSFKVLDTLKGSGTEYTDNTVENGKTYTYRVKSYNDTLESNYSNEASLDFTGITEDEEGIPTNYSLSQNYPNPFNPSTKIKFALPHTALTRLIIYDVLGREVKTLVSKELGAGYYEINFDATNLRSGVYFYRIQAGNFIQTKKLLLVK
jgi:hypothetical protein